MQFGGNILKESQKELQEETLKKNGGNLNFLFKEKKNAEGFLKSMSGVTSERVHGSMKYFQEKN